MQPRQAIELTESESWQLLRSVSLGRIVFTQRAMPAIRPVNHLADHQTIIIRSHLGSAIVARASAGDGTVVAYEADEIDPVRHTGWSVIATGLCGTTVTDRTRQSATNGHRHRTQGLSGPCCPRRRLR